MSFFNQNEDETVRQTLERVMREKGMWKEPKTMHTEIGDFSYYDDDDGNGNAPTNAANNQSAGGTRDYTVNTESLIGKPSSYFQNNNNTYGGLNTSGGVTGKAIENVTGVAAYPNTSSYVAQNSYVPSPVYGASKVTGYQVRSPYNYGTQPVNQSINTMSNTTLSPIMQPIHRHLASVLPQYTVPALLGQNRTQTNASSYQDTGKTAYDQFVQSDAYSQLRDFHILQEGYERTIDDNGMVFPYPDINGDITGCIGHNMKNDFNTHPWISTKTGQPMNSSQISSEEEILRNTPVNLKPELYVTKTSARLPQEYCENLYDQDIKYRWQTLNRAIPNWSHMSPEMQAATMEVHFTGNMEPKDSWTLAKEAAEKINKRDYCDNLHRLDKRRDDIKRRNQWVSDMCMKGKFYK